MERIKLDSVLINFFQALLGMARPPRNGLKADGRNP